MRFLTRHELSRVAQRVLREYWRLPAAQELPYAVDPVLLAKELLGLRVRYRHLSSDGRILGLTGFSEMELLLPDAGVFGSCVLDGRTVLLERDLLYLPAGPGRRNFTLGHECAHHIMRRLYPADYGDAAAARRVIPCTAHGLHARGGVRNWEEWQMDVLSSELLMPEELLRRNLALAGCPEGFPVLNPVWRREEYGSFTGLCRMMGVSAQAMAYRLELLGLLGKNQAAYPDAMVDIWMGEEEVV